MDESLRPDARPATNDAAWLEQRFGREYVSLRTRREPSNEAGPDRRPLLRRIASIHFVAPLGLRCSGLLPMARRRASRIEVTTREVGVRNLPPEFDGFRILHLSDLHADISPLAMAALPATLEAVRYDACAVTGDYRGRTHGPFAAATEATRTALQGIRGPRFGILGNHDSLAMVPDLEAGGLPMLVNEATSVERGGRRLWFAGVDDPHTYRTDDLASAMRGIPRGAAVVLLSHSTENHAQAAEAGVGLFLCGHTHGGQICLPGGTPMATSTRMPRRMASGAWRTAAMEGYTSRGVGSSVIEARLNCPAEATIHVLRTG